MKDAFTIAGLTLKLLRRKGVFWALGIATVLISTLLFYMSRSDGVLVNELEIRLTYAYSLTYAVLSLVIIALACFTIRSQIDAKNIHMLTSYPIHRKWILAGQALALIVLAAISELILLGTLFTNSYLYAKNFDAEEIAEAKEKYFTAHRKVSPLYKPRKEVALEFAKAKGKDLEQIDEGDWIGITDEALKAEQLIEANEKKEWQFELGEFPPIGDSGELIFRFRKKDQKNKVHGIFEFRAKGSNTYFKKEVSSDRYVYNSFKVPLTAIPENGKFTVTFQNTGGESCYVMRTGLYFNYVGGGLAKNLGKVFAAQTFHLATTCIIGLCAGIALTFSVSSFFVIMLFLMSFSQGVFESVWEEYVLKYVVSTWEVIGMEIFRVAVWLTKGLQPPSVISDVAAGLDIRWSYLLMSWLPPILTFAVGGYILGSWMLTKKELDKVQT